MLHAHVRVHMLIDRATIPGPDRYMRSHACAVALGNCRQRVTNMRAARREFGTFGMMALGPSPW